MVEISKALLTRPKVLILDEPTSALNTAEVDVLLALLRRLAGQGVAIIYVSHRMREIPAVADTLTVLRDGEEVATRRVSEVTTEEVARMIAGTEGSRPRNGPATNRATPHRPSSSRSRISASPGFWRVSTSSSARARCSGSPGSSAPAAPNCSSRSSAPAVTPPAPSA
ncbi:hypothetical protein G7085_07780 [Tessaracoccus sp. HDW20]|uniref:hypothetical protein n=1 Tax=Tessaracoccus coleopterorum TaxID=2714950 RepID=UPI0018D4676A|nr:hypothetical protein [Tessaracoccus coleopterorum]